VLADVRCLPGVQVALVGDRAWVRWEPGQDQVLTRLLPVSGVVLFAHRKGAWYQLGHSLRSFDVPLDAPMQPLHRVLLPARLEPRVAPPARLTPVPLRLVREDVLRQTSAVLVPLHALRGWAEQATTATLTSIRAARRDRHVLLLGRRLPLLPEAERFWGGRVLTPLGHRLDPLLPEREVLEVAEAEESEFLLLHTGKVEIVPTDAFEPLTRAGIRLALSEIAPHG
jgi:hypothetical protein